MHTYGIIIDIEQHHTYETTHNTGGKNMAQVTREWIEEWMANSLDAYAELMTVEGAEADLRNLRAEGIEVPEDLTAEEYAAMWNEMVEDYRREA